MLYWLNISGYNTIRFYTSPNLKDWTLTSSLQGDLNGGVLFLRVPRHFRTPDRGKRPEKVGGHRRGRTLRHGHLQRPCIHPEQSRLPAPAGSAFYAAQVFNEDPLGRVIQVGWFRADSPNMPFNNLMTIPQELKLKETANGLRMTRTPVEELKNLRSTSYQFSNVVLASASANPLAGISGKHFEIRADISPGSATKINFVVRGIPVVVDPVAQTVSRKVASVRQPLFRADASASSSMRTPQPMRSLPAMDWPIFRAPRSRAREIPPSQSPLPAVRLS